LDKLRRIALLGGGPAALFMLKRLVETGRKDLVVDLFEQKHQLGRGMPYSNEGSGEEHVTNVSANEIPAIVTSLAEWSKTSAFNEYKDLPRLMFGQYLADQFGLLLEMAEKTGVKVNVHFESEVTDVAEKDGEVTVTVNHRQQSVHDIAIMCTGHHWPAPHEDKVKGYFDSPYPPAKLHLKLNHPVAIKGSSLTAVDAIRTLARQHGRFDGSGQQLSYHLNPAFGKFKIVLHALGGLLPAMRFNLNNTHLEDSRVLKPKQIAAHIAANDGFLSLDYIFENDFKKLFKNKDKEFYAHIKAMTMEEFVTDMMTMREESDPFQLLKAEYAEAERSIKRKKSVYWKELLGVLSFAMNYPAKHFSAEDMLRLQQVLLPLISVVIAYLPQSSAEELLVLHASGVLEMVAVDKDSCVEPAADGGATYTYNGETVHFKTFINCTGQPHLSFKDFPFKSLVKNKTLCPARLRFRSGEEGEKALAADEPVKLEADGTYYLQVPGITINDSFQVVDDSGAPNKRIYVMAVPYIGGYNPDYSGLDFCEAASEAIIKSIKWNAGKS
jgi:hypothetical protein